MHRIYFIPYHALWFIAEILEWSQIRLFRIANHCGVKYEAPARAKRIAAKKTSR